MFGPRKTEIVAVMAEAAQLQLEAATQTEELADQLGQLVGVTDILAGRVNTHDENILKLGDALDRLHAEVRVLIREELDARESEAKS